MKMARMISVLVVITATVLIALGIFDALSWDEIKDSMGKVILLGVLLVACSLVVSFIAKDDK